MSMKAFDGDFDALTGAIFASWFSLGPKGPAAYAVGFAETTHRPWSLFYRGMRPTGATTYLGTAVIRKSPPPRISSTCSSTCCWV